MARNKKILAILDAAGSPSFPISQKSESSAPFPSQAAKLLDGLTHLHAHGWLEGDNEIPRPDHVRFNIGNCTWSQLCDHIKQRTDWNGWFV